MLLVNAERPGLVECGTSAFGIKLVAIKRRSSSHDAKKRSVNHVQRRKEEEHSGCPSQHRRRSQADAEQQQQCRCLEMVVGREMIEAFRECSHQGTMNCPSHARKWGDCRRAAFPPNICRSAFRRIASFDGTGTGKSGGYRNIRFEVQSDQRRRGSSLNLDGA